MDIRQLRYFVAVAEELNFSRAAIRLHMSQPPLSQQIKALEDELGVELLIRTRREVRLSDAGKVFLRESRAVLSQLQSAIDTTHRTAQGGTGDIRLGVATSAMFNVMPQILERFRCELPDVNVLVTDMGSRDQIDAVRQEKLDIGIVHQQTHIEDLESRPIFSETLCLAVAQQHPLSSKQLVSLDDLKHQPFVSFSRDYAPTLFDAFIAACGDMGFSPRIVHTARHPLTIFQMVRLGLGLAFVPASFARSSTPGVSYLRLDYTANCVHMCAIWNPKNPSQLMRNVVDKVFSQPVY